MLDETGVQQEIQQLRQAVAATQAWCRGLERRQRVLVAVLEVASLALDRPRLLRRLLRVPAADELRIDAG